MRAVYRKLNEDAPHAIMGLTTYNFLNTDYLRKFVMDYVHLRNETDCKDAPLVADDETLNYVISQTEISLRRTFSSFPCEVANPSGVKMAAHFAYWMVRLRPISFKGSYKTAYKEEESVKIAFDLATLLCELHVRVTYKIPDDMLRDKHGKKLRFMRASMTESFVNDFIVYTQQFVTTPQHFLFMLESFLEGKLGGMNVKNPDKSW